MFYLDNVSLKMSISCNEKTTPQMWRKLMKEWWEMFRGWKNKNNFCNTKQKQREIKHSWQNAVLKWNAHVLEGVEIACFFSFWDPLCQQMLHVYKQECHLIVCKLWRKANDVSCIFDKMHPSFLCVFEAWRKTTDHTPDMNCGLRYVACALLSWGERVVSMI